MEGSELDQSRCPVAVFMLHDTEEANEQQTRDSNSSSLAEVASIPVPGGKISSKSVGKATRKQPCRFFLSKQSCRFGDRCKFLHVSPREDGVKTDRDLQPVCRWFIAGGCRFGDRCKFRHPVSTLGEGEGEGEKEEAEAVPEDLPSLLNVTSFPGLNRQDDGGGRRGGGRGVVRLPHRTTTATTQSRVGNGGGEREGGGGGRGVVGSPHRATAATTQSTVRNGGGEGGGGGGRGVVGSPHRATAATTQSTVRTGGGEGGQGGGGGERGGGGGQGRGGERGGGGRRGQERERGPPELSLEAFFQGAKVVKARPHVQRPKKRTSTSNLLQVSDQLFCPAV